MDYDIRMVLNNAPPATDMPKILQLLDAGLGNQGIIYPNPETNRTMAHDCQFPVNYV